jgi:hypothetical protein
MQITRPCLANADPEALKRLARSLGITERQWSGRWDWHGTLVRLVDDALAVERMEARRLASQGYTVRDRRASAT